MTGPYSICGVREHASCCGQNTNLIEKAVMRENGNGKRKGVAQSPLLVLPNLWQVGDVGSGTLFPF